MQVRAIHEVFKSERGSKSSDLISSNKLRVSMLARIIRKIRVSNSEQVNKSR